jgi:hypothetical protein
VRSVLKAIGLITPAAWGAINVIFWILDRIENAHTIQDLLSNDPKIQPVISFLLSWYFPAIICVLSFLGIFFLDKRKEHKNIDGSPPIPADTKTTTSLILEPNDKDRIIIHDSPEYLMSLFNTDHTSIRAIKLIEPYIGKWMRVSGRLRDVREGANHVTVTFESPPDKITFLFMYFQKSDRDRLSILRRGSQLVVIGQISRINRTDVDLENCELISVSSP